MLGDLTVAGIEMWLAERTEGAPGGLPVAGCQRLLA
jgi:hypothetical protein